MNENFARMELLPTYIFAITNELKAWVRAMLKEDGVI
jgi:hypothetical protein